MEKSHLQRKIQLITLHLFSKAITESDGTCNLITLF